MGNANRVMNIQFQIEREKERESLTKGILKPQCDQNRDNPATKGKKKIEGRKTKANFMKTFKIKEIKGKGGWVK